MSQMFQEQLLNQVHKLNTIEHALKNSFLAHFRMLIHEWLSKDTDIFPKEAPLIILDINSAACMANNSKDTNNTRRIVRRVHFVRNGEK